MNEFSSALSFRSINNLVIDPGIPNLEEATRKVEVIIYISNMPKSLGARYEAKTGKSRKLAIAGTKVAKE